MKTKLYKLLPIIALGAIAIPTTVLLTSCDSGGGDSSSNTNFLDLSNYKGTESSAGYSWTFNGETNNPDVAGLTQEQISSQLGIVDISSTITLDTFKKLISGVEFSQSGNTSSKLSYTKINTTNFNNGLSVKLAELGISSAPTTAKYNISVSTNNGFTFDGTNSGTIYFYITARQAN